MRIINVEAASVTGAIRSLQGISGAPRQPIRQAMTETDFFGIWGPFLRYTGVDVSEGYRRARIDIIRTHDMPGAGDLDSRYSGEMRLADGSKLDLSTLNGEVMFPDINADPEDAASYNFGPTDALVRSIVDVGAEVIFRIGRTIYADTTPPDPRKYAAIAKRVVMHYNHGWANGFNYGIKYWELWNEPDYNFPLGFWSGTPEQFYELYAHFARAIKSVDPALLVGGPAISLANDDQPFREGFVDYVKAEGLPLDFFSWHWYAIDSNDPMDFARIGADIRRILDERGLTETKSILDEWNCEIRLDAMGALSPAERAAFLVSSTLYMQDAPIDRALYYNGYTPFGADGCSPNEVGHALIALGKLKESPVRLALTGDDRNGFAAIAGRSEDGKLVQLLISNFEIPSAYLGPRPNGDVVLMPEGVPGGKVTRTSRRSIRYGDSHAYQLNIEGLADSSYEVRRYRISDRHAFALIDEEIREGGAISLAGDLPPAGIDLVVIRSRSAM